MDNYNIRRLKVYMITFTSKAINLWIDKFPGEIYD